MSFAEVKAKSPIRRQTHGPWLITFGDLLTLVLCFFIATIRFGPLGKRANHEPYQVVAATTPGQSANQETFERPLATGTFLAPIESGQVQVSRAPKERGSAFSLVLREQDFALDLGQLRPEVRNRLLEDLRMQGTKQLTLEVCSNDLSLSDPVRWRVSHERARSILEMLGAEQLIRFRILGPYCEQISPRGTVNSETAALIYVTENVA